MASKVDVNKTNDFLRRRKLRLQQVREQSKDIARKIRQRARVENLRHLDSIEAKKEKDYFDCQEKLVKHLEFLYSKGLQNVGAGHKGASEVTDQDCVKKTDISKLRGKEAAEALRKKKQEKLDEQKKILDRKLQAREAANELSREKSATVSKNLAKQTSKKCEDLSNKAVPTDVPDNQDQDKKKNHLDLDKNDMGTQWESDELLNEWVPNVPVLSLPKDDSVKESLAPNTEKTDKSKRPNLFALSDEMPLSLRGGQTGATEEEPVHIKPSLTLVSEYLQNRNLRLRESQPSSSKRPDDLQTIKQTILHTRAARTDEKTSYSTEPNAGLTRKKSITVYNHNTRNIQDKPVDDEKLVSRDSRIEEDAYSQALKETTLANSIDHKQLNKHLEDMRTKVAVTKNNVDKEYKDTLAFLNSLARDNRSESEKPIKTAYMDEHHQHLRNERYQKKLQEEFKKIENECQKHNCKHSKRKVTISDKPRNKSRSPVQRESRKDFEYSWMPVPESDGSLAVHTIPNINARNKSGNTVKFSQAENYHEYRSRHKHTPPTKEISNDRQHKTVVEKVILQETNDSDVNESSVTSETSSVENLNLANHKTDDDSRLKDAERIIIYKILESKKGRKRKENKKNKPARFTNTADVTDEIKQIIKVVEEDKKQTPRRIENSTGNIHKEVAFEQLQEGVYEAVKNNGNYYNLRSCYTANVEMWQSSTERKPWWDNIASMYFTEGLHDNDSTDQHRKCNKTESLSFCCNKNKDSRDGGDTAKGLLQGTASCNCGSKKENKSVLQPSAATSATSFTTAVNDKTNNCPQDEGFLKLVEGGGQDSNKFYVGASGFLKDDNYEVIIQLRKKDTEKSIKNDKYQPTPPTKPMNSLDNIQEMEQNITDSMSGIKRNERSISPIKIATSAQNNDKIDNNEQDIVQQFEKQLEQKQEQKLLEIEPEQRNLGSQLNKLCEKAVYTSFQDEFAIPVNVSKTDPVPRPATSTYTQTSFNSSMPRPAFIHMSSSTSTAYMSPPEHILPKFLKHGYVLNKEELYESENTMNQLDSNFDVIESEHCNGCRCNDCFEKYHLKTPPNTARSCSKETSGSDRARTKTRKCKCHKCRSRSDTNICHKNHNKKSKTLKTKSIEDLSTENLKQSAKNKILNAHTNSKTINKMNSVVKKYVNKLLALNSEGLKAIEIINQDCSAVTTPGSSIINLPCNKHKDKPTMENKISLEQIKDILKQHILKDTIIDGEKSNRSSKNEKTEKTSKKSVPEMTQNGYKLPKKKSLHKVKSLNISKRILKKNKPSDSYISTQRLRIPSASYSEKQTPASRSKSSTTPRKYAYSEYKNSTSSDIVETSNSKPCSSKNTKTVITNDKKPVKRTTYEKSPQKKHFMPSQKSTRTSISSDSDTSGAAFRYLHPPQPPIHTSTQTNGIIDNEIHFMKIAEDKLQNMEKIADLTEKCTQRLSNLAKVLEEVRRNKSLVYSQISTSDSTPDSDPKPGRNLSTEMSGNISDPNILPRSTKCSQFLTSAYLKPGKQEDKHAYAKDSVEFTPFLKDIPKPDIFKTPSNYDIIDTAENTTKTLETENNKSRAKPPPALSRMHLKFGEDVNIIPHELSTVIEVDSPMSMRIKSQTSRQDTKVEEVEKSDCLSDKQDSSAIAENVAKEFQVDPDLLKSNKNLPGRLSKVSSTDSSDDSKMRMMDMKKFNDIMLKPFISLKEYAKQCNIGLDEGSNLEDVLKDDPVNDEFSSLHSDGSLPDVIAELLKRNIISEPFKFDTASNVNSTTVSSESNLSVLALSKVRKEKKKSAIFLKNKENVAETSETLSISSNPDLENAFQKLGMGWASSTLKKTKERLALSSSSNTSTSSMTQFKIRSFSQDVPNLGTDSTSSLPEFANKRDGKVSSPGRYKIEEKSRNAVQQTSLSNSMTVKEFLTNELAKKITFNNKSTRKGEEEFLSLYETKMPEEMKHTNVGIEDEQSSADASRATHNRARTSTPVQIFKSQTYHSTSTSNTSNGFFSNADDLSSVKVTSASIRNHSTSDKDDLTVPNYSLKTKKMSDRSKSD